MAVTSLNGQKLEGRPIRVDWDYGFRPGREFGRGEGGIQIRDCVRKDADFGRHQSRRPITPFREGGGRGGREHNGGGRNFNPRVKSFKFYRINFKLPLSIWTSKQGSRDRKRREPNN